MNKGKISNTENSGIEGEGIRVCVGEMFGYDVGFIVGLCAGLHTVLK